MINISIHHEMSGQGITEREEAKFKEEHKHLLKTIKLAIKNNMRPIKGDSIYGDDDLYFVKRVCFDPYGVQFYLNENEEEID